MKILVTGGSGFIGKAFIKKYRQKFDIAAPTRAQMDLMDARAIDKFFANNNFDAVVHLAGASEKATGATLEADNLIMFKNIQYMSIVHGVKKLIAVCSGADLDRSRAIVDITEDKIGESIPTDGYGLGEYLINMLASKDKITTVLRIFDVYGAGGGDVISKLVTAGARGRKQLVLDRDRTVSAIYVDDAVRVIAELLTKNIEKSDYNLVSDDKTTYLDVAKLVKRLVKKDGGSIEITVKRDGLGREYSAKNDKLMSALPMRLTSVSTAVKKMYGELKK